MNEIWELLSALPKVRGAVEAGVGDHTLRVDADREKQKLSLTYEKRKNQPVVPDELRDIVMTERRRQKAFEKALFGHGRPYASTTRPRDRKPLPRRLYG